LSDEKFIICPNCGAILEKEVQFCGFCGSDVTKKKSSYTQPQQSGYSQPSTQQYGAGAPGQHSVYGIGALTQQQQAEAKLRLAGIFAWLTFCGGSIVFLILTIIFAMNAKKLGSTSPKIRQSIGIAVLGTLLSIASIIFYVWYFWGFPLYF